MTNLQDKLHKQVYVPVSVNEKPLNSTVVMIKNEQFFITTYDEGIGFGLSGGERKWLKPTEQSYLLSGEELLELKKQWAAEGFDAGFKKSGENMIDHMIEISKPAPDKEQYINSLTL